MIKINRLIQNTNRAIKLLSALFYIFIPVLALGEKTNINTGDYLSQDYLEIIDATKSPAKAASKLFDEPASITATKAKEGIDLILLYNFHEGGAGLHVSETEKVSILWSGGGDFSNASITVNSDNSFVLRYGKRKDIRYIHIGDQRRFVEKKVLVGNYVDLKGIRYYFDENGWATFGPDKFQYEIGLDYVERAFVERSTKDYFQNIKTRDLFEFEIIDGSLILYRTSGEMAEIVDKTPFATLRKID